MKKLTFVRDCSLSIIFAIIGWLGFYFNLFTIKIAVLFTIPLLIVIVAIFMIGLYFMITSLNGHWYYETLNFYRRGKND